MRGGTDEFAARQAQRRRKANLDAAIAIFWELLTAALLLWLRARYFPEDSILRMLLLIVAVVDAALIIPIFIVRNQRMKEIAGGEEDEASQY